MYLTIYALLTIAVIVVAGYKLSIEGFLLADRKVPSLLAAISLAVSKFGGGMILAYGSLVYIFGAGALWYFVGFAFGYMLFVPLALRLKRLSDSEKFYTITDFYQYTFGQNAKISVGYLSLFVLTGFTCINVVGGARILSQISEIPYTFSVLFVSIFIGGYLLIGGFRSVILTDFLQGLFISACIVMLISFAQLPDNFGLNVEEFFGGIVQPQIIYICLFGFFMPFGNPEVWPRIYALKDERSLYATVGITILFYLTVGIMLSLLILSFRDMFPGLPPPQAILTGLQSILPIGLQGLLAVFLFAAVMSSADTYLFHGNSVMEQDLNLLGKVYPEMDIRSRIRLGISLIVVLSTVVALLLPDIVRVALLFTAGTFVLGFLGVASVLRCLRKGEVVPCVIGGMGGIVIGSFLFGIDYYIPLIALCSTFVAFVCARVYYSQGHQTADLGMR